MSGCVVDTMRMATCHPERRHEARGLCVQCYVRTYCRPHRAAYYAAHKEEIQAQHANYNAAHKEEKRLQQAIYRHGHKEAHKGYMAKSVAKLRLEIFNAYGGIRCACPKCPLHGGADPRFLTMDHINGDGAKHRRETQGTHTYRWLKKNGFPLGFQVLCYNCNCAKRLGDHCPHLDLVDAQGD